MQTPKTESHPFSTDHSPHSTGKSRYMPGLDGLRAFAVFAVIAYHLNLGWAPGGLLGVGVFFVLSGYLITDLLISEWRRNGKINLTNFWMRRARRLLPAMFLILLAVVLWGVLFNPSQVQALRGDVPAALLYVSNWWFIFHKVSYFASFGPPSPLGHLWSLAVEEQFYLLWPLLLLVGLSVRPRRGQILCAILSLTALSAFAMAFLYQPGTDPSRVYYGTDTRAFALLIGAALAVVWPSQSLAQTLAPRRRIWLDVVGAIGFAVILIMIWKTNQYESFLYQGGLVVLSVATALTIAVIAHPASYLGKILGWKPLRWLGVRSYGIYLWHYPVIILTSPSVDTTGIDVPRAILQVVTSVVLAALSWRYIEKPIRYGTFPALWNRNRPADMKRSAATRLHKRWVASACVIVPFGLCLGLAELGPASGATQSVLSLGVASSTDEDSNPSASPSTNDSGQTNGHNSGVSQSKAIPGPSSQSSPASSAGRQTGTSGTAGQTSGLDTSSKLGANLGVEPGTRGNGSGVTVIGDSVMVGAAPYIEKTLPGIVIDAKVGRQLYEATAVVNSLKASGKLGNRVVLELGTNGPFTKQQLVSLLQSIGSVQQVVLINSRVPRPWQSDVNSTLAEVAASYPNTTVLDWFDASANKNSMFYSDGVHLNPEGASYYASLIAKVLTPSHT